MTIGGEQADATVPRLTLNVLRESYSICRLPRGATVPPWASAREGKFEFSCVSRTEEELSIVCPTQVIPADLSARSDGWRGMRIEGKLDLDACGILVTILSPLAEARVPVFSVATFDTDYLFVRDADLPRAVQALRDAGHAVRE